MFLFHKHLQLQNLCCNSKPSYFATKTSNIIISSKVIFSKVEPKKPLMYIINLSDGGFVIISATKDYYPILAYSSTGNFTFDNINSDAVQIWLNETIETVNNSSNFDTTLKKNISNLWSQYLIKEESTIPKTKSNINQTKEDAFQDRISCLYKETANSEFQYEYYRLSEAFELGVFQDSYDAYQNYCRIAKENDSDPKYTIFAVAGGLNQNIVGPLLTTNWSQSNGFNIKCDSYPDNAGCGTIAISQIMRFHQFPVNYNWTAMENNRANEYSQTLIRDVNRKIGGSGSTALTEKNTFTHFGYTATIVNHSVNSVINEILNHRKPVLMGGYEKFSTVGHSWVCDGVESSQYYSKYFIEFIYGNNNTGYNYQNIEYVPSLEEPSIINGGPSTYFHMNWGWGLNSSTPNGWFTTNNVNTNVGNFTYLRKNIFVSANK